MQEQPHTHTLAKTKCGKSFGLSLKLGVFYTYFSVCSISIVRYKVREMQLCTALGYLCINHEIIGICLVLCPCVMKLPKFVVYSVDCRAPNDVVQVSLKHMPYQCAPVRAISLNVKCLSCIVTARDPSPDSKAAVCVCGLAILYVHCSQCNLNIPCASNPATGCSGKRVTVAPVKFELIS